MTPNASDRCNVPATFRLEVARYKPLQPQHTKSPGNPRRHWNCAATRCCNTHTGVASCVASPSLGGATLQPMSLVGGYR